MSANQAVFPIATMARVLGVSEAGYHAWRHRPASAHAAADAALLKRVRTVHASSRETHGAPRVHAALQADGHQHGHQRIARLMRAAGLTGASRRRNRVTTTRRDKDARPAPGLVDRDFVALKPNELRVADITFVQTASGFLYLAVVLDAWSRKIVGWSIANHLRAELVFDALEMATGQRRPGDEIHHSDQGSQLGLKWLSQHPDKRVAMTKRRRRSDRSGRAPLFSPGRPAVAGRAEQRRFWAAIAAGEPMWKNDWRGSSSLRVGLLFPYTAVGWKSRRHGPRQPWLWASAWSPEQIAHRLPVDFPDDETMRISHETIYQALLVQSRGALRRELTACLRIPGRVLRIPRTVSVGGRGKSFIYSRAVMISQRPAEAGRLIGPNPATVKGTFIVGLGSSRDRVPW